MVVHLDRQDLKGQLDNRGRRVMTEKRDQGVFKANLERKGQMV